MIRSTYLVGAASASALRWRFERLRTAEPRRPTKLRRDPGAPALLLSPHLDDAVFSCWSVLTGGDDVRVANVFAAAPPAGFVSPWDEWCGAPDSATLMRTRTDEDRAALARAGHVASYLPLLEEQYATRRSTLGEIDAAVVSVAPTASVVYAPAALGVPHPDHRLVREYAGVLAAGGLPVVLYADLPYAVRSGGWPAWVAEGAGARPRLHPFWAPALVAARGAEVKAVVLSDDAARAKIEAMRLYRTQFRFLDHKGELSDVRISGREVFWRLRPAGARGREQADAAGGAIRAPWSSPPSLPSGTGGSS